jgi:hypothetical protein
MIGKILKKVLRAAVAQPWDYQGDGAPDDFEFRLSPDEETFAVWHPEVGEWVLFAFNGWQVIAEATMKEMDEHTQEWRQFVSVEEPDD